MRFLVVAMLVLGAGVAAAEGPAFDLTPPIATVGFASGSAGLSGDERDGLREAVAWMKEHPYQLLVIEGFADRVGTDGSNMTLSQDRADAVHAALLGLGADPLRILQVSYGERDRPGRRVEVRGTMVEYPDIVRGQNPMASPRTPLPAPVKSVPPRRRSGEPPSEPTS
jgi:hypothetical protein